MNARKLEWSAIIICEIVFSFIGTVFTILSIVLGIHIEEIAASPGSRGNVFILPWIFGTIGIVFLFISAILFVITLKQKRIRKQLIENGRYISACVTAVKQDLFVRVNNQHPYYVICESADPYTREKLTFRSANMMNDPSHLLGQHLRVFIDHNKPQNYYVEVRRHDYEGQK